MGSAGALGACNVASIVRRHANTAPFAHMKKNACNGRLNGRLSDRNCDLSGLKSSFILPVRSLEAWGAHRSELRVGRNLRISPYHRQHRHTRQPDHQPQSRCRRSLHHHTPRTTRCSPRCCYWHPLSQRHGGRHCVHQSRSQLHCHQPRCMRSCHARCHLLHRRQHCCLHASLSCHARLAPGRGHSLCHSYRHRRMRRPCRRWDGAAPAHGAQTRPVRL